MLEYPCLTRWRSGNAVVCKTSMRGFDSRSRLPKMASRNNPQIKVGPDLIGVGIGIMVFKNGQVLLSKRKQSHGEGEYGGPGGHLEFGETFFDCAKRECKEEAGIEIDNIRFLCLSHVKKYEGKHYVDVGLVADWKSGEPKILEPEKAEKWDWYDLNKLPKPLFAAEGTYFKALKTGQNFFDD